MELSSTAGTTGWVAPGGPELAERQGDAVSDRTSRLRAIVLSVIVSSLTGMG
jgi:hypothetical protein